MANEERPYQQSLPWRATSSTTLGLVGFLSRTFLYAFNRTEVQGVEKFMELLDERRDERSRTRGLLTVSNHTSIVDDPLVWGVLPHRYYWTTSNMRFSLGSADICFKNMLAATFFTFGNTLPAHRSAHSKFGGLFQPTMTQCIRLLSDPHAGTYELHPAEDRSLESLPRSDPFSSAELTYSTTGTDSNPAPSAYPSRRFSWIHIFPEGMIHQHPDKVMRYFKWGVARLILESDPCPDVVPMWIDGPQHIMDNERGWPRAIPRAGKAVSVTFGDVVDSEKVFEPFRQRWRAMKEKAKRKKLQNSGDHSTVDTIDSLGVVTDEDLKFGKEAQQLRIDVTMAVRNEVLKVRRSTGLTDEDPKRGLADTWRKEGSLAREGLKQDGSSIRDT
ncbi:unnamed protein product [Zymoseptoria tritici ST99CH_3D7]|uniref:Tafazzin family protein n=1 Tax=Zymoseptoria tritici (strain ST99CH_3D7) TaxID=1276538 RepID=A0A1X7RNU7_ZYMT9|nr:unnamed protein product [Zymoseptoria tritici ST99CH_3D7]